MYELDGQRTTQRFHRNWVSHPMSDRVSSADTGGVTTSGRLQGDMACFVLPYQRAIFTVGETIAAVAGELTHPDRGCPIEQVSSRVKSLDRIVAKAQRICCPVSPESIRRAILDIAGVRIVCGVISDVYRVARLLGDRADVTVIEVEDYIARPKANGYKSLHMTLEVPVSVNERVEHLPVELQIRTRAMDYWASFEHRFFYRSRRVISERQVQELSQAADAAHRLDMAIERLHGEVTDAGDTKNGAPLGAPFLFAVS